MNPALDSYRAACTRLALTETIIRVKRAICASYYSFIYT